LYEEILSNREVALTLISELPPKERPREKLLKLGASNLTDTELLALLLQTGRPGESVMKFSRRCLQHFGSLGTLFDADLQTFTLCEGLGEARFALFQTIRELSRRELYAQLERGDALSSPDSVRQYLSSQLAGRQHEVFCGLFLDNRHRVIEYTELFTGTIDSAAVYPREVVKSCLRSNAAAVIFAHNHPSGVAEPSDTDVRLTRKLTDALALIDVRVLDHLVIGQGVQTSLAERGLM